MSDKPNEMPPLPEGAPDWLHAWMQMVRLTQQYPGTNVAVGRVTIAMPTASGQITVTEPVLPPPDILSLVLRQIIIPGSPTAEGMLIKAVDIPWFDILALLEKDWTAAFQIPWRKWEEIIAGAYARAGFEVTLTPGSGDRGRDVIAEWKGGGWVGSIRVIEQVKAYSPGHLVRREECSDLLGVLMGDPASKGIVTTTTDFAPRIASNPEIARFIPNRLQLFNGVALQTRLVDLLRKYGRG
jgi:restriction system protein